MAKRFVYRNTKTGKVIYESVEPNYVTKESMDKEVLAETGVDPRFRRDIIECQIRVEKDK